MAIDTRIIVEKQTDTGWQYMTDVCSQVTQAYCAMKSAVDALHLLSNSPEKNDFTSESYELLSGYEIEAGDLLPTSSLSLWLTILDGLDPEYPDTPEALTQIAEKFQTEEHKTCIAILKELTQEYLPLPEGVYRVILFWGY